MALNSSENSGQMTAEELDKIRQIIPHSQVVFETNNSVNSGEIKLKTTEWAIITKLDGEKTIEEIAETLSLSEDESLIYFYHLNEMGLIKIKEIRSLEENYAPKEFFDQLTTVLVNTIGPVASFVIDDVLWDLNLDREKFQKDKIPLLIETISQEITDPEKRVQFQQQMLTHIKEL